MTDLVQPLGGNPAHQRALRVEIDSDAQELAAYKVGTTDAARRSLEREALVLGQIRHPNVIELIRLDSDDSKSTLVTAFAGRVTLQRLAPHDPTNVTRIAASLIQIVDDLHHLGWVHGRLSADHVIVGPQGKLVICAFAAAHRVEEFGPRHLVDRQGVGNIIAGLTDSLVPPSGRRNGRDYHRLRKTVERWQQASGDPNNERRMTNAWAALSRDLAELAANSSRHASRTVGSSAGTIIDLDQTGPRSRDRSQTPRSSRKRAPFRGSRNWRGVMAAAGAAAGLLATIWLLRWLGGPLSSHTTAQGVSSATDLPSAVVTALQVVRLGGFVVACYGIAIATATATAIATQRTDIENLAIGLAPKWLRHTIVTVIGLGLAASVVTSTSSAVASGADAAEAASSPTTSTAATSMVSTSAGLTPDLAPRTTPSPSTNLSDQVIDDHLDAFDTSERTWTIEAGDHLWRVAESTLQSAFGRDVAPEIVDHYWRNVVDLNRSTLIDPTNPDLVHVGQQIKLPPLPTN